MVFYTIVSLIIVALLSRDIYLVYLHPLSRYPGPFFARFTNLWRFKVFFAGEHHIALERLHKLHGPIVRTGPNSLSFSSLAAFTSIYGNSPALSKGGFYSFARTPGSHVDNIFSATTPNIHRDIRKKVVGPALTISKIAGYGPVISKHAAVLIDRISDELKATGAGLNNEAINIAPLVHKYTLDAVLEIIFGPTLTPSAIPYTSTPPSACALSALKISSKMAWGSSLIPFLGTLLATRQGAALVRKPTFDASGNLTGIGAIISRARALVFDPAERGNVQKQYQDSILKHYLEVADGDSKKMDDEQMVRESVNFVFAGPGSTAAGLTAVLFRLGTSKGLQWQDKIREEIAGKTAVHGVLGAVITETLRLHAPFPTGFPRIITPGTESYIPGLVGPLPVGTEVSANPYILGRSTDVWGSDAETWNPQRWLVGPSERRLLDEKFVAFSKGPRQCIGKDIAMKMLETAVKEVLVKWDIRTADTELIGNSWLEMQIDGCWLNFVGRSGM